MWQKFRDQKVCAAARAKNAPQQGERKRQFQVQRVRQNVRLFQIARFAQETISQKGIHLHHLQGKVCYVRRKVRFECFWGRDLCDCFCLFQKEKCTTASVIRAS